MMRIDLGRTNPYCDNVSRRSFLQIGMAGMGSIGLPSILRAKENAAKAGRKRDTSVILIWLDGGPSHMDTYDMKPDAPELYRGIWKPITTKVPGFNITEMFPHQAGVTDKFSVIRSIHHDTGDHFAGAHRMLTAKAMGVSGANTTPRFPSLPSIATREVGSRKPGVPPYASVPVASSVGINPGYFGGQMIGMQYDPFQTGGDPNAKNFAAQGLTLGQGLSIQRLEDRQSLMGHIDGAKRKFEDWSRSTAVDQFTEQAFELVTGPTARNAFKLDNEDPRMRDKYGRHTSGQSMLLARRLVEAGVTFVTVHLGGWDHHWDLKKGYENYLPKVDQPVAALFEDLAQRGMLDSTMVILCGEFSRTPKMNDGGNGGPPGKMGTPGRDHWGNSLSVLIGGGGVQGGRLIGSTDRLGTFPQTRPLTPSNLHATVYKALGINPNIELTDPEGRPMVVLDDPTPIEELF
jgi:hypothetical protein